MCPSVFSLLSPPLPDAAHRRSRARQRSYPPRRDQRLPSIRPRFDARHEFAAERKSGSTTQSQYAGVVPGRGGKRDCRETAYDPHARDTHPRGQDGAHEGLQRLVFTPWGGVLTQATFLEQRVRALLLLRESGARKASEAGRSYRVEDGLTVSM